MNIGYHTSGILSVSFFALTIWGLYAQLQKIYFRKHSIRNESLTEAATAVISVNQTFITFLGFLAFFVYGFSVSPFNHYLVWPRLIAGPLVVLIQWELANDRRTFSAILAFSAAVILQTSAFVWLTINNGPSFSGQLISQILTVGLSFLFLQSYVHQILEVRRNGQFGAVSLKMYVLGLMSDLCNVAFGLYMGIQTGWPILLDCGLTAILKSILLWHHRWVSVSPVAKGRRSLMAGV